MKMLSTGAAVAPTDYPQFIHNCTRSVTCEPMAYYAPLPGVPYLQLYVDFGTDTPLATEITLVDLCDDNREEQLFANGYVVGQTPEGGWYGVFKYFTDTVQPVTNFVVHLSALVQTAGGGIATRTFFSQALQVDPCGGLTKLKSCHPEGATTTGFDLTGLYYGLPQGAGTLGNPLVRYFHIAWVRQAFVRERPPTGTFTTNLIRNFRTTIERSWVLETELVPNWYKDLLLALYARGAIGVDDGTTYLVDSLAYESVNDEGRSWRPYVNLKRTTNLYYGCDTSDCPECCSPVVVSATAEAGSVSGSPSPSPSSLPGSESSPSLEPFGELYILANVSDEVCECVAGTTLYSDQPFGPGVILYTDSGLTTPVTTFTFIRPAFSGDRYNLDDVSGEVGSLIGTCPNVQFKNEVAGASIDDSTVGGASWFIVDTGAFPLTNGQSLTGTHGGFTGSIAVVITGTFAASGLRLFSNCIQRECIPVSGAGTYTFASLTFAAGARIYIELGTSC